MPKPFQIFPWNRPFLPDLKAYIEQDTGNRPGCALIIAPHKRPWRYYQDLCARDARSAIMPRIVSFAEMVSMWNASHGEGRRFEVNQLDQVATLRDIVNVCSREDPHLSGRFANWEMEQFLPWGLRLARVLDEIFAHGLEPLDLVYAENDASPVAAALLSSLGRIGKAWRETLDAHNWTTPGYSNWLAQKNAAEIPPFFLPSPERPVYIAGFYALNGAQEKLFRSLWNAGANICLHTDAALAEGSKLHPQCREHRRWLDSWSARPSLAASQQEKKPEVSFFAGYDAHSQLLELKKNLEAIPEGESTAIVLADPCRLMPVLHHLPGKDVNVSMGFPLNRSQFGALLEDILTAAVTRSPQGLWHWRRILRIIRHPYLNLLAVQGDNGEALSLRPALRLLDEHISAGVKYVDLERIAGDVEAGIDPALAPLLRTCLEMLFMRPAQVATMKELAQALEAILKFFLEFGAGVWPRFPLDEEAISRLASQGLPALRSNALADEPFPLATLQAILQELTASERIPFEADPLVGIQLIGLLETRLLHFDNVLVLDASDDLLPGDPPQDPLLPDSLRGLLGLPDGRSREAVMGHHLFRLCAGASRARFLWAEGGSRSAIVEGRRNRSRFVEQLIWEKEKASGELLIAGKYPFDVANGEARAHIRQPGVMERTGGVDEKLNKFLSYTASPSQLDVFLNCPLKFAWQYLLELEPAPKVNEGNDNALAGSFVHGVLFDLLNPWLGQEISLADIPEKKLSATIEQRLVSMGISERLPADAWLRLEIAARKHLGEYLKANNTPVRIAALEKYMKASFSFPGRTFKMKGMLDRLDQRENGLYLLDYKSGKLPRMDSGLWTDAGFFSRLAEAQEKPWDEEARELYLTLRSAMSSIQLPVYLTMLGQNAGEKLAGAAYVDLRDTHKEVPLFSKLETGQLDAALEYCGQTLQFLTWYMLTTPFFEALPERQCDYCVYGGLCSV